MQFHALPRQTRKVLFSLLPFLLILILAVPPARANALQSSLASNSSTTAWQNGQLVMDTKGVVGRSDIILGQPNLQAIQSMPLGNGTLGAAVWGANGLTAQLNRTDTFPDRKSPGWLVMPGLATITGASNYQGRVDLYGGMFIQSGNGMTATSYVRADKDELVVDVTGANPTQTQTVQVQLWSGRSPTTAASGAIATLSETWVDNTNTGSTGATFGSLAALTASGQNIQASVVNAETIQVTFKPNADGTFRVIVGAPTWTGGNAMTTAQSLLGTDASLSNTAVRSAHLSWWHTYWSQIGLMELSSSDGAAQYMENIRMVYLYTAAAEGRGQYPGSQAGVGDLFSYSQDSHQWVPADYWQWNLRMQVAANMGAGAFSLNNPYFHLYTSNLSNIEAWTKAQMGGRAGVCIPETMRFNGNGYYGGGSATSNASCDANIGATYNARTLSTGAEVSLWIWQQYLYTGDLNFLSTNYPIMAASAQFLLAYATVGSDGYLHTNPSNAHETQWDVSDPTTDVAAMQALFPAVVQAAILLNRDATLVAQLQAAIPKIQPFPRTDIATQKQLLTPSSDAGGQDMIGMSTQPAATLHNSENLGLEPVWPYDLIGDNSGSLTQLAIRTFTNRDNKTNVDWNFDPIQAARLGLANDVASTLITNTEDYQGRPSGLAGWSGTTIEPYVEESGVVATALQEAMVQDYDGLLRITPAWPSTWDADGVVYIHGGSKVSIQYHGGTLITVGIQAGSTTNQNVRNPWSGQNVEVVNGSGTVVVSPTTASTFTIPLQAGQSYLIEQISALNSALPFAQVQGKVATTYKTLGPVTIGLSGNAVLPISSAAINSGGAATGLFSADTGYSGGSLHATTASINTSGVSNPAPQAVYQTERYGNFTYTVPNLAPGAAYIVRLHFAEIYWTSSGQRIFNVAINGQQVLSNFDIYATAGGANKALVEQFTATASASGSITIQYTSVVDNAKSSGIEVLVPSSSAAINSGGAATGAFSADTDYSGGSTSGTSATINTNGVANPAPQAVYQTERYGNFTYTVPNLTPGVPYIVRLHFAEIYWNASGKRTFNVSINGTQVLSNFDIYATAGGQNIALVETFTATASVSGSITIQYTSIVDNAKSSGIEVLET